MISGVNERGSMNSKKGRDQSPPGSAKKLKIEAKAKVQTRGFDIKSSRSDTFKIRREESKDLSQ